MLSDRYLNSGDMVMMRLIVMCGAAILFLSACGDTLNGKGIAEPEVVRFHERLKAHEFESMYDSTGDAFRSAISKEKAVALFSAIDRKLGQLQDAKQINWSVNTRNTVTTVTLVYQSRFSEGEATETFTFNVDNDNAQLIGYNISSLDMLIK
jgi:hypothetical protein